MGRAAVTVATVSDLSARAPGAPDTELERQLSSLGRQIGYGRRFRPGRPHLLLIGLAIVGLWLVLVFGRALTSLNEATARQAILAGEANALEQRLEAGRREQALVQTDSFQALQARSFGLGEAGERVFSLSMDVPTVALVEPLGAAQRHATGASPLDAWLTLLFGE